MAHQPQLSDTSRLGSFQPRSFEHRALFFGTVAVRRLACERDGSNDDRRCAEDRVVTDTNSFDSVGTKWLKIRTACGGFDDLPHTIETTGDSGVWSQVQHRTDGHGCRGILEVDVRGFTTFIIGQHYPTLRVWRGRAMRWVRGQNVTHSGNPGGN